ncbi:MAG: PAS domain S-box protein [Candidatus Acidiferrales bacterium]
MLPISLREYARLSTAKDAQGFQAMLFDFENAGKLQKTGERNGATMAKREPKPALSHAKETSSDRYATMVHSSPDAITLRSLPDRRYLEINEGFTRLTGYTAAEVLGRTSAELNLWVEQGKHRETLHKMLTDGEIHGEEFKFRTKTGEIRYAQVSASRVTVNGQPCMLSITHDITDLKHAQEDLEKSESLSRSLIEEAPYGIYRVTIDGQFLQVNPALVAMLGYDSAAELLHCNIGGIYKDPKLRERLLGDHWKKQNFSRVEAEWRRKDGKLITVRLTGRPVVIENGELKCFEVFAEDVTEHRSLERQFLQSQKMEAIGRLAGGVAHDFNNLLGVIIGQTEIVEEQLSSNDPLHKRITAIRDAANRAAALTSQLLAFSRKQVVEPTVLDLNESVKNVQKLLRRLIGEDVQLAVRFEAKRSFIRIDPGQLEQVMMNLAINARDAMPRGGKLIIETADVELGEEYIDKHWGSRTGPFVLLSVSDTGVGMDSEVLSHLFEPFFTTKEKGKGTGLGLSTVYGVVKQNGGHIIPYSELGRGTIFKIYFPHVSDVPQTVQRTHTAAPPRGSETVLLVEDEPSIRELTREVLEDAGYEVLEASDPRDALRIASDSQKPIQLLLTDVVMPDTDGRQLASEITSLRPDTKVLFMSGYTHDVIAPRGVLDEGMYLVQKPFTRRALLSKIRDVLG